GAKTFPAGIVSTLVEAAHRAFQSDDVGLAIPCEVHELGVASSEADGGLVGEEFDGGEAGFEVVGTVVADCVNGAEVALVEALAGLLCKNAEQAFAVEVPP